MPRRPEPYPVVSQDYPVLLPYAVIRAAGLYMCPSCIGYRYDYAALKAGHFTKAPCPVCENEGAIRPGETMFVDLAASTYISADSGRRFARVLARLRCPWVYTKEDYWTMSHAVQDITAWGPKTLHVCATRAVLLAARGMNEGGLGVMVDSVTFNTPIEWPSAWNREPPPRGGYWADVRDVMYASLDYPEILK